MAEGGSTAALAGYNNIFQIQNIRNEQTINTNRWSIQFKGLKEILTRVKNSPLPAVKARYDNCKVALGSRGLEQVETTLELSLFSVTIPSVKLETQDISRFNDTIKAVTKFAPMEDLSVVFWDYVDGSASAIMQLWHALVGDKVTGAIGFKQDFVLPQAFFFVYGPDAPAYKGEANDEAVEGIGTDHGNIPYLQKYEIWNLFPNSVELGEHSDAAEARKVTCTFSIDNIFPVDMQRYGTNEKGIATYIPNVIET